MKIYIKFSNGGEADAFKAANESERCARILEASAEHCVDVIQASPVVVMNILKALHDFMQKEFVAAVKDAEDVQKQFKIIAPGEKEIAKLPPLIV